MDKTGISRRVAAYECFANEAVATAAPELEEMTPEQGARLEEAFRAIFAYPSDDRFGQISRLNGSDNGEYEALSRFVTIPVLGTFRWLWDYNAESAETHGISRGYAITYESDADATELRMVSGNTEVQLDFLVDLQTNQPEPPARIKDGVETAETLRTLAVMR